MSLNGAFWTQKNYGVEISSRKWNLFVTHEFPCDTLILRMRLSVLYTKCIQFFLSASLLSCTCYVGEMMTPCQLSTFSEFICSAFQFKGLIAQKISKCMKNKKWSQKGLKIDDVALNGAFWTQKNYGLQISSKNEIPL